MKLHEKHRPRRWSEMIGQPETVNAIARLRQSGGLAGRAYALSGPSGCGKTTIARLIAAEVSEPFYREEIDGSKLTGALLDDYEKLLRHRPLEGRCWVFIVNEYHLLTPRIIGRLLVRIDDKIRDSEVWIFTTTQLAKTQLFDARLDASAFLSRCVALTLSVEGKEDTLARYVQGVAEAAELDGKPFSAYKRAIIEAKGNLRTVINAIEAGQISGANCEEQQPAGPFDDENRRRSEREAVWASLREQGRLNE